MKVLGYEVTEFFGKGDPFFGGSADDRPLGKSGEFLTGVYVLSEIARFETKEEAEAAVAKATKRKGGLIGISEVRDWSES